MARPEELEISVNQKQEKLKFSRKQTVHFLRFQIIDPENGEDRNGRKWKHVLMLCFLDVQRKQESSKHFLYVFKYLGEDGVLSQVFLLHGLGSCHSAVFVAR